MNDLINKPLTAKILSKELAGDLKQRIEGKRSLRLEMEYGKAPSIKFDGFWNGKFLQAAINSISKAYRLLQAKRVNTDGAFVYGHEITLDTKKEIKNG
jgi:hypothetical protein